MPVLDSDFSVQDVQDAFGCPAQKTTAAMGKLAKSARRVLPMLGSRDDNSAKALIALTRRVIQLHRHDPTRCVAWLRTLAAEGKEGTDQ